MIIVDTNVVSELMRANPDSTVLAWFAANTADTLFLTSVSEAELRTGAAILPAGQRRDQLVGAIEAMMDQDFAGRILPFDSPAARTYAEIATARRAAGKPIMDADCQIAAKISKAAASTSSTHGMPYERRRD
jgi:hypothetical protein